MPETIRCSECNKQLRVPAEMLGKRVKCPACGATFVATSPAEEPEVPVTEVTEEPVTRRPRADLPEESEEELPRRRRRRRDEDEEFEEEPPRRGRRAAAASKVVGPAIGIMIVGGLGLLLAVVGLILNLTGAALLAGAHGQGGNTPPMAQAVGGIMGVIVGLCWSGVVLSGGLQMLKLKSYGYAMTGAIVGMVPCSLCCILGLPFGIWALVVLNDPEVKSSFR